MRRLGCRKVADAVLESIRKRTEVFTGEGNSVPSLAVVLVGEDPASMTYVRKKAEAAASLGFMHFQYNLDADTEEKDLLALIDELAIGKDAFVPCTPKGIMKTLEYYGIETAGRNVTVIGRSNIVGKPMALLLMQRGADATVTVCNTKTKDLKEHTLSADIIIVAAGHPGTIDSSYVQDGAAVIDVGVNRIEDPTKEKGFRLTGDADYDSFSDRDVSITPVPGGVGLMTVSMLMVYTLEAAIRRRGK